MPEIRELDVSRLSKPRSFGVGSYYDYERDILAISSDPGSSAHVAAHEMGHYLDHVSTPYGFLLDRINTLEIRCAFSLVSSHSRAGLPILSPSYDFAKTLKAQDTPISGRYAAYSSIEDEIRNSVGNWSNIVYIKQVFDEPSYVSTPSISGALKALSLMEDFDASDSEDDLVFDKVSLPKNVSTLEEDGTLAPFIEFEDGKHFLGASEIFELLAVLGELNKWGDHLDNAGLDRKYSSLYFVSMKLALDMDIDLEDSENYNYLLKLMFLCAKLSLFTPAGACFRSLRADRNLTWADVHPGHRYWRAIISGLSVLSVFGRMPFDRLQSTICDQLNWPNVEDFFDELEHNSMIDSNMKRFSRYLALYAENSFCLVTPEIDSIDENALRPNIRTDLFQTSGALLRMRGMSLLLRKEDDDRGAFVFQLYGRAMCNDVMLRGKLDELTQVTEVDNLTYPSAKDTFPRVFELGIQRFDGGRRGFWSRILRR